MDDLIEKTKNASAGTPYMGGGISIKTSNIATSQTTNRPMTLHHSLDKGDKYMDNKDLFKTMRPFICEYNCKLQELIDDIERLKLHDHEINIMYLQQLRDVGLYSLDKKKKIDNVKKAFTKLYDKYSYELEQLIENKRRNV
jgi:hypothetical protein